jgi:hypothetical protein
MRRAALLCSLLALAAASLGISSGIHASASALPAGMPASRIRLDAASATLNIGQTAHLTVTAIDWKSNPLRNTSIKLAVLYGPAKGFTMTQSTDANGQTTFSYDNKGGPGSDVLQATFADSVEIHKSNRPVISWLSGVAAEAIASQAAISVSPPCFQPASSVADSSDTFTHPPKSQKKGTTENPGPPSPYNITVDGNNFNPFTAVLVTFDVAPGGTPESFQSKTDGFGHFNFQIHPSPRLEGPHLIRADDFRQREANAVFSLPCFQPSISLEGNIGPPGFVPVVHGTGFPANTALALLAWQPGITAQEKKPQLWPVQTDASGNFQTPILVLYRDIMGPRILRAIVPLPAQFQGVAVEADTPFLVAPGREQPPDFLYRR